MPTVPVPEPGLSDIENALREACPTTRFGAVRRLDAGYTSNQWVASSDEGDLLVKVPMRNRDPEHLRRLMVATRLASAAGVPVVRFRAFVPASTALGGPFLVQEFCPGEPASARWDGMTDDARQAFARELGTIVGNVHGIRGTRFGDVLGKTTFPDLRSFLHAKIEPLLDSAPADIVPAGRKHLANVLDKAIAEIDPAASPRLMHGDLWRENVLVDGSTITCLLDFEHASFADQFLDFGKLDEHIFNGWPAGRESFLASYRQVEPLPADWRQRRWLAHGLHALAMYTYFSQWTPKWAPQYQKALTTWLPA